MKTCGSILIADDEPTFLTATSKLLQCHGFQSEGVPDGFTALTRFQKAEYDLFICDLEMPGNEDLACIRQVAELVPGLPIILVTGHPSFNSAVQLFQLPVIAYLVKPVLPEEFLEHVRRGIKHSSLSQAVTGSRRRAQDHLLDLQRLEQALRNTRSETPASALNAFPWLSLQNVHQSLVELQRYAEALTRLPQETLKGGNPALQPMVLLEALRSTIGILEKTKSSFKSKELAELRRRLEQVVGRGGNDE